MTVRVGIVGCGLIGFIHSYTLRLLTSCGVVDAAVVATYDADRGRAESFAAAHDAVVCADVDELVDRVDAVWVCTWTAAHLDVVAAAVAHERAVFCEKPLAPTLADCEQVAALLARVPHQVGLVLRSAPVFEALVAHVHGGAHGRALAVVFRDDQFFPTQGFYASDWRADVRRAGGGTLLEHSIHDIDVLRWLLGEPTGVRASVAARFGHPGIDDVAAVTLTFADEAVATLTSVWHQVLSRGSSRRVEVFCERALLWLDDDHLGPLHLEAAAGTEVLPTRPPAWVAALDAPPVLARAVAEYAPPTRAFLDALRTGAPVRGPDAAVALAAHRVVDAAYRSSRSGEASALPAR